MGPPLLSVMHDQCDATHTLPLATNYQSLQFGNRGMFVNDLPTVVTYNAEWQVSQVIASPKP